jgi:hypothetical protein
MRASPAFQVVLDRFGVWRWAVLGFALSGACVMAAWLAAQPASVPAAMRWLTALVAFAVLGLGACASRVQPVSLRWDGQLWHLGPPASAGHEPRSGELRVLIDLGPWMLLRFEPAASTWRHRATWLPAQRRGLESQWHALRCAAHSPRPQPGADVSADF